MDLTGGAHAVCYLAYYNMARLTDPTSSLSCAAWKWTAIIAFGILATTVQTHEFRDEAGNRTRGRHILVTELGRKAALWIVSVSVAFWSLYTPLGFFVSG
jgi:4-hydroxybenzoate polyprenyltransferase